MQRSRRKKGGQNGSRSTSTSAAPQQAAHHLLPNPPPPRSVPATPPHDCIKMHQHASPTRNTPFSLTHLHSQPPPRRRAISEQSQFPQPAPPQRNPHRNQTQFRLTAHPSNPPPLLVTSIPFPVASTSIPCRFYVGSPSLSVASRIPKNTPPFHQPRNPQSLTPITPSQPPRKHFFPAPTSPPSNFPPLPASNARRTHTHVTRTLGAPRHA
jgi:hypothetical protein